MKQKLLYFITAIIFISCNGYEDVYSHMENYSYNSQKKELTDSIKTPLIDSMTKGTI